MYIHVANIPAMAYPRLGAYEDIELLQSQKNPLQGILRIVPGVFFNFKKDILLT